MKPGLKKRTEEGFTFSTPESESNAALELLKQIDENAVHIGGTDYRIDEKFINNIRSFVKNITD